MPSSVTASPLARVIFVALTCGCSLTLDWDRDESLGPIDGGAPDASADVVRDFTPGADRPTIDIPIVDTPQVDRPVSTDRPCAPACRGGERCCNGVCRECCSNSDCHRYCCNGTCQERC